jgi:hypothetical protein
MVQEDNKHANARCAAIGEKTTPIVAEAEFAFLTGLPIVFGSINPNLTPTQHAKAAQQVQDQDAVARRFGLADGLQLHRPGFRRNTWDAAGQERTRQAYSDYDSTDAQAYKQTREFGGDEPRLTGSGAPGKGSNAPAGSYPLSAGEGSSCTIDGAAGTLVRQGNWLVCRPAGRQDAATIKQAAYDEYDRIASNAWRSR